MNPKTAALALREAPQAGRAKEVPGQLLPRAPWSTRGTVSRFKRNTFGELQPMVSPNFGGTKEEPKGEVTVPKGMDSSVNKSTWLGFC